MCDYDNIKGPKTSNEYGPFFKIVWFSELQNSIGSLFRDFESIDEWKWNNTFNKNDSELENEWDRINVFE